MDETKPARAASKDGTGRRRLLECMAWAGTGVPWTIGGGVPCSHILGTPAGAAATPTGGFSFVQISDSHIGFDGPANVDVTGTLRVAISEVKARAKDAAFMIHTGDVSHTSKYGFDAGGVHFIGLDNVTDLGPGGLGYIGPAQLAWLKNDLAERSASQPIVVMAHIPLWQVYPKWGWGTEQAAAVLALLKRFGSVTVLNGHIHQIVQKIEGNVAFHTARSTAFPRATPGGPPGRPGPLKVADARLKSVLGTADISYVPGDAQLAIIDTPLGA